MTLIERLRSRAWEHRQHRHLRELAATRIEQLEAALRDIRPHLDSLICYASTIGEHSPNGFPARVDGLLRETTSVSISNKSVSAAETPGAHGDSVLPCDHCGQSLDKHAGLGMPCPTSEPNLLSTWCNQPSQPARVVWPTRTKTRQLFAFEAKTKGDST